MVVHRVQDETAFVTVSLLFFFFFFFVLISGASEQWGSFIAVVLMSEHVVVHHLIVVDILETTIRTGQQFVSPDGSYFRYVWAPLMLLKTKTETWVSGFIQSRQLWCSARLETCSPRCDARQHNEHKQVRKESCSHFMDEGRARKQSFTGFLLFLKAEALTGFTRSPDQNFIRPGWRGLWGLITDTL